MATVATDETGDPIFRMPRKDRREKRVVIGWAIFGLLSLFLFWEAVTYNGLIALAAEWQFNVLGRYYPALTYILLALVIASPLLIWAAIRRRRAKRAGVIATTTLPALFFLRLLSAIAVAAFVAALVVWVIALSAPSAEGTFQQVRAGPLGQTLPATGPTLLSGRTLYEQTAGFDEDLWITRHSVRFAPIIAPAGDDGKRLRFFVELPGDQRNINTPPIATHRGILEHGGLPGEIIRLYRYAGHDIDEPYYVLFASQDSLRWPLYMIAAQCLLAGIIFTLAGLAIWVPNRGKIRLRRK